MQLRTALASSSSSSAKAASLSRKRKTRALLLSVLASCAIACSSSYVDYSTGFGGTGGSFVDASTSSSIPEKEGPCETAEEGDRCTYSMPAVCEIGLHANPNCNSQLRCAASHWIQDDASSECVPEACPSAFDALPADGGGGCTVPHANTIRCEYDEGTCGCSRFDPPVDDDGGLDASPEDDGGVKPVKDAGENDSGTFGYTWQCIKRSPGCPRTRPRLGTSCVKPLRCDYGSCLFDDGMAIRCSSQFWDQDESFACDR